MKLVAYVYDGRGCSLASPEIIISNDALDAYACALRHRDDIQRRRGVPTFLHTVEGAGSEEGAVLVEATDFNLSSEEPE